jgi:hypothetical protein
MLGTTVVQNCSLHMLSFSDGCTPSPPPSPPHLFGSFISEAQQQHHHHITPPPPPHLSGSFISEAQQVHTTHTLLLIHYQHSCCCMGVFNTTYSSHHSPKRTEQKGKGEGGEWLITYWLWCATKQNKKFKTIWENLQLKQTNGWLENKERVESVIKKSFFHNNGHQTTMSSFTGAYNPHLRALNVCIYVCIHMCVCVFFTSLFRGT